MTPGRSATLKSMENFSIMVSAPLLKQMFFSTTVDIQAFAAPENSVFLGGCFNPKHLTEQVQTFLAVGWESNPPGFDRVSGTLDSLSYRAVG